jgi:hypothetical protein
MRSSMRAVLSRALRRLAVVALPAVLATGAAGCHTYKYFDMHVALDPATFDVVSAYTIMLCQVTVSGADSDRFTLDAAGAHKNATGCPNLTGKGDALDAGSFEFSSFADSGTMKFTVDVFNGPGTQNCIFGTGESDVKVTSAVTIAGSVSVAKTGTGCATGTPGTD